MSYISVLYFDALPLIIDLVTPGCPRWQVSVRNWPALGVALGGPYLW